LVLIELIADLLPPGVINVVNGFGGELGRALVTHPKVSKAAFTGSTATGRLVMQYATENIIPVTLELGGKSPNIFFNSVMDHDDDFLDKAIEGAVLFALNQGEICTCPSRLLIQEEIFGPVLAVTTFKDEAEALAIANDTIYGLGAGVWTRDAHQLYQIPRAIQAGRVWVNQYHSYPAGAPFGGYKQSGIGRENHKLMLDYYRQTKNMLISYSKQKLGFF